MARRDWMNGGLPPDLMLDERGAQRNEQMAEALLAQSSSPLQGRMVGNIYVKSSPTEGIAKLLQAYVGNKAREKADESYADLGNRYRQGITDTMAQYQRTAGGTPEYQFGATPVDDEGNPNVQPAVKGDPRRAIQELLMSPYGSAPQVRTMAQMEQQRMQGEQAAEQRAAEMRLRAQDRLDQIEAQAREGRLTREEADRRSADLRRELAASGAADRENMVRLAASLRPPRQEQAPVAVVGDDGKPVLVSPSQAIGRTPVSKTGGGMSATSQKELIQTEEEIQGGRQAVDYIKQSLELNDKAMGFTGAGAVSSAGTLLPSFVRPKAVDATENLDNLIKSTALPQLKAVFGGLPTEGERKILLDVQGSVNKSPSVRKEIFDRAMQAAERRIKFNEDKAKKLRSGTYFAEQGGEAAPAAPAGGVVDFGSLK